MKPLALLLPLLWAIACGGGASSEGAPAAEPRQGKTPDVAAAPAPSIELRRGRAPRELVRIGIRGAGIGPEEGPLRWKYFGDPRRTDDAWYLLGRYAPFRTKSPQGDLVFRGYGGERAGQAERRMILEWARQVAVETAGGRGGEVYGLVFAWHQGGPAGLCEDVSLHLTGEAVAAACGWDREVRGRLEPEALAWVYRWFDRLQAFQTGSENREETLRSGQLEVRLVFAGQGASPAGPPERAEIQAFAAALFEELAATRRSASAVSRFLAPAGTGARREIRLELPEKPPPPPRRSLPRPSLPAPSPQSPS
jgi:hypothetical protein